MAALGGGRDGWQLCSVLCNLEAACAASELSRAEPSRSVPGQDLSLLPTSSPCAAAKPPLGKGLNFWFWPSSVSPPCVIMLHKLKKQHTETVEGKKPGGVKGCLASAVLCCAALGRWWWLGGGSRRRRFCSIKLALWFENISLPFSIARRVRGGLCRFGCGPALEGCPEQDERCFGLQALGGSGFFDITSVYECRNWKVVE